MKDFTFYNPTRIEFGEDKEKQIGAYMKELGAKKVLVVYGSERVKRTGLFELVAASLRENNLNFVELGGVVSNPLLSKAKEGVALAKEHEVDAVLGVGGGSVLDSCKVIAAGAKYDGDVWDLVTYKAPVTSALSVYSVLTLAATGSEMNTGGVITHDETLQKLAIMSPHLYPKVSVVNPALMRTVSPAYLAYSAVDIIAHCADLYFPAPYLPELNASLVESIIKVVIKTTETLMENPNDDAARGEFAWASTLALNGLTFAGAEAAGFPNHMIEHALSALHNVAHGAGLAVVIPAWMRYKKPEISARLERFGKEIFNVDGADATIEALENWFKKVGAPITLGEAEIPKSAIPALAENALGNAQMWGMSDYNLESITEILQLAI